MAAIIIEPVQGEGGFVPASAEYLHGLREICDEHGIVLIADEVQSGFGRTGRMFAMEHFGVEPDLVCVAKSIAGGVPHLRRARPRGDHGRARRLDHRRHVRRQPARLRGRRSRCST